MGKPHPPTPARSVEAHGAVASMELEAMRAPDDYLRPLVDAGERRCIVAFPHAGGAASAFRRWGRTLEGHADLVAIQLPGREDRFMDPPEPSLLAHADRIAQALLIWVGSRELSLFGHSLGALLAFEVARRLEAGGVTLHRLTVSAMRSPRVAASARSAGPLGSARTDRALLEAIAEAAPHLGAALAYPEFAELFLVTLRGDLALYEGYSYDARPSLVAPIAVLHAPGDALVATAELAGWRAETRSRTSFEAFPGGHFFCFDDAFPIVRAVLGEGPG